MGQHKIKVLVVEDEAIVAVDIDQGLTASGYEICGIAASGKEAIALATNQRPDIVLMDIRLQGKMTGIEAAEEIRSRLGIPIIFLTAHSDDATLQTAKQAQPFGYLLKPFGVRELRVAIETALYKADADRKLADSEEWNRTLIEKARSCFIALDSSGAIVDWNPSAAVTLGWLKEEVLGKSYVDLLVPDRTKAAFLGGFRNLTSRGEDQFLNRMSEQYLKHRDGHEIPVDISFTAALLRSKPRYFAFVNDISRRKQYEIQRARAEELEKANHELERFAHLASHDLQEPLRTISMYTQLLEVKLQNKANDEEKEMFEHVIRGAKRMTQLVDDLLNYSKVGANEKFEMEKIPSQEALDSALANLEKLMTSKGVRFSVSGKLPLVLGNTLQLALVFQNLISNAIKFSDGEKPIKITVSATRIGEFWRFLVQDNGIGFDMSYAEKIFDLFKRLHSDPKFTGTGAGLAICKKVIGLHGGRIWAESQPKKGAKFYFTVPAVEPIEIRGALSGLRLLVVDDALEARTLIVHLLNGTGAIIEFAENGFDAIDQIKASQFDLVLMDIEMPSINGIETVLRMRQEGITVPVIAFSNLAAEKIKKRAPEKIFVDYISKSMPPKLLVDHLHMWYTQHA